MKWKTSKIDISVATINITIYTIRRYYSLRYVNAKDVLPPDVLDLVQKYTGGALIYVPKKDDEKIGWGQKNGARAQVHIRNNNIIAAYRDGASVYDLMLEHCLSEASIRKILYNKDAVSA